MDLPSISGARGQLRPSSSWRGPGNLQLLKIPTPATGQSFIRSVPGDYWEKILALVFTFTTSGAAGQRQVNVLIQDGDGFTFNATPLITNVGSNQSFAAVLDRDGPPLAELPTSLTARGSVTSPAAGASIASTATVQTGEYTVQWSVELEGTVAAATDNDNFGLYFNGQLQLQSENQGAVGVYPQLPVTVEAGAVSTFAVKAINLATVGAIYVANLSVQAVGNLTSYGQLPDLWLKSGWQTQIQVVNPQAGDALTGIAYLFERVPSSDIYQSRYGLADELAALIQAALQGG